MKAGLEVHQQLAVGKLFCGCPGELSDEVSGTFERRLRPASGENRAVDVAAAFQAARGLTYRYESGPANCLVEMDEEPPHAMNAAALETALTLALLLHARPVDEIVVMRKIVVDGSNTGGFQRTALVALDGSLELGGKRYSIPTICLEEDAARKIRDVGEEVVYRLDRLGIPLIEIATGPEIASGEEAREVAEEIGALVRATGRARRGIGTVREDLNVSVEGGHRVEIKGVQELRKIGEYVRREAERQTVLLGVRDALRAAHASVGGPEGVDVTALVADIPNGPIADATGKGGPVLALSLPGFAGHFRSPPGTEERLGRELADQARAAGLRGLLHSDELPAFGVTPAHVAAIRSFLRLGPGDGFVLVADRSAERAARAVAQVARRAAEALDGVPGETRDPLPDGRTRYSRPLPGRDRMYPETDVPPLSVPTERIVQLRRALPERPAELRARLAATLGLSDEIVRQVVAAGVVEELEDLTGRGYPAALVARLVTQEVPAVVRPPTDGFSRDALAALLSAARDGRIAKEGFLPVLQALAEGAATVPEAIERAGLAGFTAADLADLVARVVAADRDLIDSRGDAAFSAVMGDVMKEVRGRRDGREVADAVRRALAPAAPKSEP